jgi:hypothetical protein
VTEAAHDGILAGTTVPRSALRADPLASLELATAIECHAFEQVEVCSRNARDILFLWPLAQPSSAIGISFAK